MIPHIADVNVATEVAETFKIRFTAFAGEIVDAEDFEARAVVEQRAGDDRACKSANASNENFHGFQKFQVFRKLEGFTSESPASIKSS